jgi:hypothetical protein
MAVTLTEIAVRALVTTSLVSIANAILSAETVVNELLVGTDQTQARLELIGLYLAAHFVCVIDPRASDEKIGDASTSYQGATGKGYEASFYGQTAMQLDASGILARSQKPKASLTCFAAS